MNTASTIHTSLTNLTSPIDASRFAHLSSRRPAPARAPIASRKIADLGHGRNVFWPRCTAPAFERDVLTLRSRAYGRPAAACRDAFDDDGDHYVSYQKGVPMYAVRASRASATRIECEEYYPRHIVERFRDRPVSCGRLVRNPDVPGGSERMTEFMAASWTDLIAQGVRIEISNAIDKLLPYYRSLGYIPLGVPTFLHPVWGTVSHTLCFIADRMLPGSVNARLPAVADPVPVSSVVPSYEISSTGRAA